MSNPFDDAVQTILKVIGAAVGLVIVLGVGAFVNRRKGRRDE